MKLFTTITSERGKPVTKSGNENLHIEIKGENRQVIATMTFRLEKTDDGKGQSVIAQFLPSGKRASETEVWEIFLDKPKTARECKHGVRIDETCLICSPELKELFK